MRPYLSRKEGLGKGKRERGKRERGRRGDRRGGGIKKRQTGGRGSDKSTDKLKTHTLSS